VRHAVHAGVEGAEADLLALEAQRDAVRNRFRLVAAHEAHGAEGARAGRVEGALHLEELRQLDQVFDEGAGARTEVHDGTTVSRRRGRSASAAAPASSAATGAC